MTKKEIIKLSSERNINIAAKQQENDADYESEIDTEKEPEMTSKKPPHSGSKRTQSATPTVREKSDEVDEMAEINKHIEQRMKFNNLISKKEQLKPMSKDQVKRQQQLIILMERYANNPRFGPYLKESNFRFHNLKSYTIPELETELERIRTAINCKNATGWMNNVIFTATRGMEGITVRSERIRDIVDLSGLTELCEGDEQFLDTLEQLQLEYSIGDLSAISPEKRILLLLGMNAMKVAGMNKVKKKLYAIQQAQRERADSALKELASLTDAESNANKPAISTDPVNSLGQQSQLLQERGVNRKEEPVVLNFD